jgi:hypothetical protein
MPNRALLYIGSSVTSFPSKKTFPAVGVIIPIIIRKVVVLPAPLRPSRPTMLRCAIVIDTPLTTALPEYFFTNSRASSKFVSAKTDPLLKQLIPFVAVLAAYYSRGYVQSKTNSVLGPGQANIRKLPLRLRKTTNTLAFSHFFCY